MENMYRFSEPEIIAFALVLLRLSAFIVAWPIFGVDQVPGPVKILFSLSLTMMVFPIVAWKQVQQGFGSSALIWMGVREVFIGLSLAFLARMILFSVRIAGEMISVSIGLSGAQLFNPMMGGQVTPIDQLLLTLATLFFLGINGHHLLLAGIVDSFRVVPLGPDLLNVGQFASLGSMIQEIVTIGIKLSAPVVMSILLVNLVMGILGKTVPQINVLVTSLPVNIMVGIGVLVLALPFMFDELPNILEFTATRMFQVLKAF